QQKWDILGGELMGTLADLPLPRAVSLSNNSLFCATQYR
ncbi:unnamed protein product, partial [marine sediment metagenome]